MAGRIAGLTIEIGGDTTKLQSALKGVDGQLRTMRTGLKDVDRLLKFNPTSTQLITQKQQMLKQSIEQTKQRLDTLKQAQAQMDAKGVDKNSEEYKRLQREIIATEGQLKNLEKQYAKVASVAGVQLQAIGGKMKELGAKISEAGQAVTTRLTAPIVALGAASVKAFSDVDKGMDAVVEKTGATGEALNGMKDSVKNLATSIPIDFETAGNAVGEVATRFGLTGDALEDLAGKFAQFAKLNNTDVSTSVDEVQKALSAFGLSSDDASGYLDRLNKVGQDTGVKVDKLAQGIVTNSGAFQEMGLNIDQATIFMGQLEKSGANSETVLNGMRRALKNAAKEGKPLNQALSELQDEILNGKGGMDGLTKSYELFGKSGDQIYSAVKNGTINFKDLGITVEDVCGNIETTFENTVDPVDKFKMALNQAKLAGADLGNALLTTITPMIEKLQAGLAALGEKFRSLSPAQQEMIVKAGLIAAAIGPVVLIVGKLVSGIGMLTTNIGTAMINLKAFATGTASIATAFGIATAGAVAFVAIAEAASKVREKQLEKEVGFNKVQKEHLQTLEDSTNAYKEVIAARDESVKQVEGEFGLVENLRSEYNSLVDSNGNIKKGYEDRAEYIKGEHAEALGLEKSEIEELINKNGLLKGKIDELIATKKAQALLDANEDAYKKALEEQQTAAEKLGPALTDLESKKKALAEAEAEYAKKQKEYNEQEANGRVSKATNAELEEAREKWYYLSDEVGKAEEKVKGYTTTLEQTKSEIDRYDGLTKAIADKDKAAIEQWTTEWTQGIKTRKTATQDELTEQAQIINDEYETIKAAYEKGGLGVTKEMVDLAKERRDKANKEAGITAKDAEANAEKESKATAKGAKKGTKETEKAFKDSMDKSLKAVNDGIKKIKDKFPFKVGKIFSGSVKIPSISATLGEKLGAKFPVLKTIFSVIPFAKAYDNPKLFTNPTMYGGALFGDRGTSRGGELVYGRENLLKDIASVTGGGTTINVTVNGAESPEEWADRFVQEYKLQTRTV